MQLTVDPYETVLTCWNRKLKDDETVSFLWFAGFINMKLNIWIYLLTDKACSKKDRTFAIKTLFYNIWSTVYFKLVPCTGDTPFPTFLPLLECFLERTFCDGAQFSYRIFLNLRVLKKRPNFLNNSPTSTEGALRLLSSPSGRFWQQTAICPVSLWALVLSSTDVVQRPMLTAKRDKWQFVVKACR